MALDLAQAQARMIMDDGTQAHDPEYPQRLLEFMRSGWQDKPLEVSTRVEAANYAKRRAQLSAAFPGETLIVATGHEKTRANDTTYSFRPGSDHAWLTGEHDPDAVLVVRPGGAAVLYVRPRSPRDTDELFRDRVYGELWTGRRHTLAEKATELGIETAPLADLPAALDDCAPGRTRVLRGLDPTVDAAVRGNPEREGELATTLAEMRLVKDEWEIAQLVRAVDATVLGFEDVARVLPADRPVPERLLEGVFALRARHDGNGVGYGSIVGAGSHATTLHWTRHDGHTRPGELLLMDMGVQLKRRHSRIPNLVETVKGYAAHERGTLEAVISARNSAMAVQGKGPGNQAAAEGALTQALGRLFALSEAYPDLKANQNFLGLQSELGETEDKIAYARQFYNSSVQTLNSAVQSIPTNLIAGMGGFRVEQYFEAIGGEREDVRVQF